MATWQWVTQWGYLQIVTHLGQSSASQALSGHLISHSGFSHFTSQTAFLGSWQLVWHLEGLLNYLCLLFSTRRRGRRWQDISGHRISRRIKGDSGVPPIVLERKSIMLKQIGLLMTSLLKIIIIINFIYKFF